MKIVRHIASAVLAAAMAFGVSFSAWADALSSIQEKGVFTVATETANAPFDFV